MKALQPFNLNAKQKKICDLLVHKEALTAVQITMAVGNHHTLLELQELMNIGLVIKLLIMERNFSVLLASKN